MMNRSESLSLWSVLVPNRRAAIAAVGLTAALSGCASGGAGAAAFDRLDRPSSVRFEVHNLNWADATLFVHRGSERIRLGVVTGKTDDEFRVPWRYPDRARLEILMLAGSRCFTPEIVADPGDVLYVEIPVQWREGNCRRR